MSVIDTLHLNPGELWLDPRFLTAAEAGNLFDLLIREVNWQQGTITLFGKKRVIPRLQAFMADPGVKYRYSGKTLLTEAWHPAVQDLVSRIEQHTGTRFNAVLLNLYRHGSDSMGWHSDDEPELGADPVIASLSLGAERTFMLRRKKRNKGERSVKLNLVHGSLLWMGPGMQRHWQHSLPKNPRSQTPRINLTFRQIITRPDPTDHN